jgi:hypothetical protein
MKEVIDAQHNIYCYSINTLYMIFDEEVSGKFPNRIWTFHGCILARLIE